MRRLRVPVAVAVLTLLVLPAAAPSASGDGPSSFDFDSGNAAIELIVPRAIPAILSSVAPGDASIILRVTTLVTNGWFDAIAPYHPSAVGVYSRLERQEPDDRTQANKNVAMLYASYRVLNSVLPTHAGDWRSMLESVGLDPDEEATEAASIGNAAAAALLAAREHDGMNQLGDEGGRTYNRQRYADYTGYEPVNTQYEVNDPSRWQPQLVTTGSGIFRAQQFVTPQWAVTEPYSYDDPAQFHAPEPTASNPKRGHAARAAYKAQADEVLAASANLTDDQKMTAELFDNKLLSLGFSALFAAQSRGLTLDEFVQLDFLTNMAAFDTGIAVWHSKRRWDAVRPVTAIEHIYGDGDVTAWGGPGQGTVSLPADEWRSYLDVADHPEYPSGSASFCNAHAESARLFLGDDTLNWTVPQPAGSSRVEPGLTPAQDISLHWDTWTEFADDCGMSRFWGGVHFLPSITSGETQGRAIEQLAHDYLQELLAGTAPAR